MALVREQGWTGPMPWESSVHLPSLTDGLMRIAGVQFDADQTEPGMHMRRSIYLAELKRIPTPLKSRDIHVVDMNLLKDIIKPMILEVLMREDTLHVAERNIGERLAHAMLRFPVPSDGILTAEHDRKAFTEIGKFFPNAAKYSASMDEVTENVATYWGPTPESVELAHEWRLAAQQLGATLYGKQWDALHYYR